MNKGVRKVVPVPVPFPVEHKDFSGTLAPENEVEVQAVLEVEVHDVL